MKIKPLTLPSNPTLGQWTWWKRIFSNGLSINEITEDAHKLTFLRSHAVPGLIGLIGLSASFADARAVLDRQFERSTHVIQTRHQLLSSRQKEGESMHDFIKGPKILVELLECGEIKADAHRNLFLRDAVVAGVRSNQMRIDCWSWIKKSVYDCI